MAVAQLYLKSYFMCLFWRVLFLETSVQMTFLNSSDINKESLHQWDAEYIVLSDYF